MEMPPDILEVGGVHDLSVVVTVDESFTTEQTDSGSLSTHRETNIQTSLPESSDNYVFWNVYLTIG
jgi:hypothetical protein